METMMQPEYLDYRQVEAYCGLSRTTSWRLIKAGELEAVKLGRLVKVRRQSLDAYLERHDYNSVASGGEE